MTTLAVTFELLARERAAKAFNDTAASMEHAAKQAGALSRAGKQTGDEVEKGAARGRKAMGLFASTLSGASAGALGPLQEIADKFELVSKASEAASSKAGKRLLGIGLTGTAVGGLLSSLGSKEKEAEGQLSAAFDAVGLHLEDYKKQLEETIKTGEHFGQTAVDSDRALNTLVVGLRNPTLAFKDYGVAIDLAAKQHISLGEAATIVSRIYNGSGTRFLKQLGIDTASSAKATKDLARETKAAASAASGQDKAQKSFNDKLAIYQASAKHSVSQTIALRTSHDVLLAAIDKNVAAQDRLKKGQEATTGAILKGQGAVDQAGKILKGQAAAAADTFTGHLKALGAQIDDNVSKFGKNYGPALLAFSSAITIAGAVVESGMISKIGRLIGISGKAGDAAKAMGIAEAEGAAAGAAGIEASAAAGESAMLKEAATAEATGARIRTALSGFGKLLGPLGFALGLEQGGQYLADHVGFLGGNEPKSINAAIAQLAAPIRASAAYDAAQQSAFNTLTTPTSRQSSPTQQLSAQLAAALNSDDPKVAARARAQLHAAHGGGVLASSAAATAGNAAAAAANAAFSKALAGGSGGSGGAGGALAKSIKAGAAAAKTEAKNAAQGAVDAIKSQFQAAQGALQSAISASLAMRKQLAGSILQGSSITDVFGGSSNLNANGAFSQGGQFGAIKAFFEERLRKTKAFVLQLQGLLKKGLAASIVQQIASAGVDAGGRIAAGLTGSSAAQLGQIGSLDKQLAKYADIGGKAVADSQSSKQIAAAAHNTAVLARHLAQANTKLEQIVGNTAGIQATFRTTATAQRHAAALGG